VVDDRRAGGAALRLTTAVKRDAVARCQQLLQRLRAAHACTNSEQNCAENYNK